MTQTQAIETAPADPAEAQLCVAKPCASQSRGERTETQDRQVAQDAVSNSQSNGAPDGDPIESSQAPPDGADAPDDAQPNPPGADDGADRPFDPRELEAARKFGLDEQDLRTLAALGPRGRQIARRLARVDSDLGRRYSRIGRAEQSISGPPPPGANDAPGPAASDEPGEVDVARQLRQLRQQVAELVHDIGQARGGQLSRTAERFFADLDAQVYGEFGRGPTEQLAADSAALARRRELLTKAAEIRRGHQLVHAEPMDDAEALRQALLIVAADARAQGERRKLAEDLRRRGAQRILRPTQGAAAAGAESAADRTAAALADWEKTRGIRFFED